MLQHLFYTRSTERILATITNPDELREDLGPVGRVLDQIDSTARQSAMGAAIRLHHYMLVGAFVERGADPGAFVDETATLRAADLPTVLLVRATSLAARVFLSAINEILNQREPDRTTSHTYAPGTHGEALPLAHLGAAIAQKDHAHARNILVRHNAVNETQMPLAFICRRRHEKCTQKTTVLAAIQMNSRRVLNAVMGLPRFDVNAPATNEGTHLLIHLLREMHPPNPVYNRALPFLVIEKVIEHPRLMEPPGLWEAALRTHDTFIINAVLKRFPPHADTPDLLSLYVWTLHGVEMTIIELLLPFYTRPIAFDLFKMVFFGLHHKETVRASLHNYKTYYRATHAALEHNEAHWKVMALQLLWKPSIKHLVLLGRRRSACRFGGLPLEIVNLIFSKIDATDVGDMMDTLVE